MPRPAFLSALPRHLTGLMHEVSRHLLKRPVVGILAVARAPDGRIALVRRGDTGEWALPGGTLEWGEVLTDAVGRELREEAGAELTRLGPVVGVYSRPDRDWRFHSVTVVVEADIAQELGEAKNALEIRDARLFRPDEVPEPLSMGHTDMLRDALAGRRGVLE